VASRLVKGLKRRFRARADDAAALVAAEVQVALTPQFDNLTRILGAQGDGADEVAGAFGRVLARLSADVDALAAEVARLHERLDKLESSVTNT
jgi:ubiquinone biosynthesis protein UbiJ